MIKNVLQNIKKSGNGAVFIYSSYFVCVLVIICEPYFQGITSAITIKASIILALTILAQLLYIEYEKKLYLKNFQSLEDSGITCVNEHLIEADLVKLMTTPGEIIILNTWIFNLSMLIPCLQKALKNNKTQVSFVLLSPTSKYVNIRQMEMPKDDVLGSIVNSIGALNNFINQLPHDQQDRVKVCLFDSNPKIIFHSSGQNAFVGQFWPGVSAVHGPQIYIEGKDGTYSERVWSYIESLEKIEITTKLEKIIEHYKANKTLERDQAYCAAFRKYLVQEN